MLATGIGSEVAPDVVYQSHIRVDPRAGGIKLISLPAESEPVPMGMHGPIAKHYKLAEGAYTPHASTLDFVVGAAAGCMTGTLGRALAQSNIPVGDGRLQVEAYGEIAAEDGVLFIRRIRVLAHLKADASKREQADRVIAQYAMKCPVYRSLYKSIEITTELDFQPMNPA
jgi:uncharacterized OsmC-like protein